jgi:hypothetical protein
MRAFTGTAYPYDPANGRFYWKFSDADVAEPGRYDLVIHVDYGTDFWNSYEIDLAILGA